eukprot:2857991-Rhodomonas_salina.3
MMCGADMSYMRMMMEGGHAAGGQARDSEHVARDTVTLTGTDPQSQAPSNLPCDPASPRVSVPVESQARWPHFKFTALTPTCSSPLALRPQTFEIKHSPRDLQVSE